MIINVYGRSNVKIDFENTDLNDPQEG